MKKQLTDKITRRLDFLYGNRLSDQQKQAFIDLTGEHTDQEGRLPVGWDEKDIILITYGDNILRNKEAPLAVLARFLEKHLEAVFSTVHILPFFPYSSDRGFSVIDYKKVNPDLGTWEDIRRIQENFHLMADLVINHVSARHRWFKNFLRRNEPGKEYFITREFFRDVSKVVRPRSTPMFSSFRTVSGEAKVWTTFGPDQPDLNFHNPEVLQEMLDIFLFYLNKGARIIRLDAIAYLWKKDGTPCIHLPETHEAVKLLRDLAESLYPHTILVTETNVPHPENISYFGDGDESHMVYHFSLPPLLLYTLNTGKTERLTDYAKSLEYPSSRTTYLNFTASHDGIGVRPLEGLMPDREIEELVRDMEKAGGMVSTKMNEDGTESPYEINITYFDALSRTRKGRDGLQAVRFICSQAIMLALKGIPGVYIHSMTATHNDTEGMESSGIKRDINRKQWKFEELEELLAGENIHALVFHELRRIIGIRRAQAAFHPDAAQRVMDAGPGIFAFHRGSGRERVTCIFNMTKERIVSNLAHFGLVAGKKYQDILSEDGPRISEKIILQPYQCLWLKE